MDGPEWNSTSKVLTRTNNEFLDCTKWFYNISDLIDWCIYIILSLLLYKQHYIVAHHPPDDYTYHTQEYYTNRSLLAHLYWVLVHMGRHWVTTPTWTVRKWSGHSQVCSRPPWRIRHRWEQPPLFTAQGLLTAKGKATGQRSYPNSPVTEYCSVSGRDQKAEKRAVTHL